MTFLYTFSTDRCDLPPGGKESRTTDNVLMQILHAPELITQNENMLE